MIFVSKTCALAFVVFLASLISLINAESIQERNIYAWQLIQEIYTNYPDYIPKLLEYHNDVKKFNLHNETYKGYLRQMRRKGKYEILLADAYAYGFKNKVFESGKRPNTVLYQCDKAIRYCSGNPTYCEYHEGSPESNIILVTAHDGPIKPKSIPDRGVGCLINGTCLFEHNCEDIKKGIKKSYNHCQNKDVIDLLTTKITKYLSNQLYKLTGHKPHMIINNLHRSKVDMNRKIPLATFNVPEGNQAYADFHELIETAKSNLNGKRGLILDIHGNAQSEHWNMFGYGINISDLQKEMTYPNQTTIRSLGEYVNVKFDQLLRGENSLGHLMDKKGYKTVPNKVNRHPGNRPYFIGDHIIFGHGSMFSGNVDSILVEIYSKHRSESIYKKFTSDLAKSILEYVNLNYVNKGDILFTEDPLPIP